MGESATTSRRPPAPIEHPLRNASYRRWLIGSAVSLFGDQFYLVALPWLVLHELGSAGMLGTVMMTGGLPRAMLMLVGGAVSDRVSARQIMLMAAVVRAVCVATIGVFILLHMLSAWEVYALVLAFGVADAFAMPAQAAYIPSLLSGEQLVAGLSVGQGVELAAYTVGPIPAGLLIARFGPAAAFMCDAASFLVVIGALVRLPDPPLSPPRTTTIGAIVEGIAYVLHDVPLRTLMLLLAASNLCGVGAVTVGIAYLASVHLGSSTAYGVIVSAGAAGSLMGVLAGSAWNVRCRGALILACSGVLGVGLMTVPYAPGIWGVSAVELVMGAAGSLATLYMHAWIMEKTDVALRGRVSSVLVLAALGTTPVSMAAAGFMATWSLTGLFLVGGGCVVVVTACAAWQRPVRDIR